MLQSAYSLLLILAIELSALRVSAIISHFRKPSLIKAKLITIGPVKQTNVSLCQTCHIFFSVTKLFFSWHSINEKLLLNYRRHITYRQETIPCTEPPPIHVGLGYNYL